MVNIEGARQVTWSTGVAAWGGWSGCKLATASVNDAPPNTADITENRVLQCSSLSSENIREGVNGESFSSCIQVCRFVLHSSARARQRGGVEERRGCTG